MSLTVKELLVAAKEIISDESKWAQGYYAYDAEGNFAEPCDQSATCFCSLGALWKVSGGISGEVFDEAHLALCENSMEFSIVHQNDEGTHEELMAVWEKTISEA